MSIRDFFQKIQHISLIKHCLRFSRVAHNDFMIIYLWNTLQIVLFLHVKKSKQKNKKLCSTEKWIRKRKNQLKERNRTGGRSVRRWHNRNMAWLIPLQSYKPGQLESVLLLIQNNGTLCSSQLPNNPRPENRTIQEGTERLKSRGRPICVFQGRYRYRLLQIK